MNKPILSICIPTYNRAECLRQCLESIAPQFQDSLARENVEVVISDNASADNTGQIVKEFQKEFPNIFYYKNSENIGYDRNALQIIEKAQGRFAILLGDDDAMFSDALSYLLPELANDNCDYYLVNCWGYNQEMRKPALNQPNLRLTSDMSYPTMEKLVRGIPNYRDVTGYFGGMSCQIFRRQIWQDFRDKQQFIGTHCVHLYVIVKAFRNKRVKIIAKPLIKTRSANMRWDIFPGLETLAKRVKGTTRVTMWIYETYNIPYSKAALLIWQYKSLLTDWLTNIFKKYLFRSQKSRDLIKKLLGKL